MLTLALRNHFDERMANNLFFSEGNLRNEGTVGKKLTSKCDAVAVTVEISGVDLFDVASDDDFAALTDALKECVGLLAILVLKLVENGDFVGKITASCVGDRDIFEPVGPELLNFVDDFGFARFFGIGVRCHAHKAVVFESIFDGLDIGVELGVEVARECTEGIVFDIAWNDGDADVATVFATGFECPNGSHEGFARTSRASADYAGNGRVHKCFGIDGLSSIFG